MPPALPTVTLELHLSGLSVPTALPVVTPQSLHPLSETQPVSCVPKHWPLSPSKGETLSALHSSRGCQDGPL